MVLAKITIQREHSSGVRGVAAYHGSVCAVYSVRVSCASVNLRNARCNDKKVLHVSTQRRHP